MGRCGRINVGARSDRDRSLVDPPCRLGYKADNSHQDTNMCTVVVMWLAGIPVADPAVLRIAASLREAELVDTAEILERAYDREARIVALEVTDREAILRVLEECPNEML